jgi:GT2 family glycosyltransferase/glycosyltransferase involved in cell wall biosynthesis
MTDELPSLISVLIEAVPSPHKIVLLDDSSNDSDLDSYLERLRAQSISNLFFLRNHENLGYVGSVNRAIREFQFDDLLVINSDVLVDPSFFVRLHKIASEDNTIATISTWTNNGTYLSLNFDMDVRNPKSLSKINSRLCLGDRFSPTIPVAVGHVIYLRRSALNLLKGFSPEFGLGYGEEVDFSLRATQKGLRNVLARDVFVYHKGSESSDRNSMFSHKSRNDEIILKKYPFYLEYVASSNKRIEELKYEARGLVENIQLAIDGSCFSYAASGTSQITMAILEEICQYPEFKVTVVVERKISDDSLFDLMNQREISIKFFDQSFENSFDFFWRPYQIWEKDKLEWILANSREFVLGVQDFIAYDNIFYHEDFAGWESYRKTLRKAMESASAVTYISEYVWKRASELGVLNPYHNVIIPNGTNHLLNIGRRERLNSDQIKVILIGHDFEHKNYEYCLELLEKVHETGIKLELIHIGKPSKCLERCVANHRYSYQITEYGEVSEEKKIEILNEVDIGLYMSSVEGFGLIPFELGEFDVPTLFTSQGGLGEFLGNVWNIESSWSIESDLERFLSLLDSEHATRVLLAIKRSSSTLTWQHNVYLHVCLLKQIFSRRSIKFDSSLSAKYCLEAHNQEEVLRRRAIFWRKYARLIHKVFPIGTKRRGIAVRIKKFLLTNLQE